MSHGVAIRAPVRALSSGPPPTGPVFFDDFNNASDENLPGRAATGGDPWTWLGEGASPGAFWADSASNAAASWSGTGWNAAFVPTDLAANHSVFWTYAGYANSVSYGPMVGFDPPSNNGLIALIDGGVLQIWQSVAGNWGSQVGGSLAGLGVGTRCEMVLDTGAGTCFVYARSGPGAGGSAGGSYGGLAVGVRAGFGAIGSGASAVRWDDFEAKETGT